MEAKVPLSYDDYTIGWICALPVETAAAKLMLDEIHPPLPRLPMDQNTYILGSIGEQNVVIASLPSGAYGNTSATTVGVHLLSSFHAISVGLLVGIGGGVPSRDADIRLGDIVVSQPTDACGGVIQYDLGKAFSGGRFQRTGMLNRPPKTLLTALTTLRAHHYAEGSRVSEFISNIQAKVPPHNATRFARPTKEDFLFQAEYDHVPSDTCINCDRSKLVRRPSRKHGEPAIHYGLIGSANQVVKDGRRRDQLARDLGLYCVEMEAAGLMNDFPCLVIRGICDYADSHKNKEWQGYAAAVAAAYAKELLSVIPIDPVNSFPETRNILADSVHRFSVPLELTAVPAIENFLGRQNELDQLWQYLQPASSRSRKVAILHGLGGIGKTQLAIRFARDHKHDFTAIFWLNGKDRGALMHSLSSIFPRLPEQYRHSQAINDEEEQKARHVLQWLAIEGNSRWLIIFDNIDDHYPSIDGLVEDAYDVEKFFPAADHGSILITSRLQDLSELGKALLVHRLESKHAIQLLLQSSHPSSNNTSEEFERDPDTLALTSRLSGLPLAIVIAGKFMRETGTNITEYLKYYQESWSDLQLQSDPGHHYWQGNILQTWMISYNEIKRRDPGTVKLLLLLARFYNRDIWYELVRNGCHSLHVPVWLKKATSNALAFKLRVRMLIKFSFLEITGQGGSYSMHPVVQDWCIHLASKDEYVNCAELDELVLISVGYTVPRSNEVNYSELQQRLIPHGNHIRYRKWSGENFVIWEALDGLGNLYRDQGKLKEAEEMYQLALTGYEIALGPDHVSTLNTVNHLGNLFSDQGNLKRAEEMYLRAIIGREKTLGPDHALTLNTANNLGNLFSDQGKLKEAEEMYQRALVAKEKTQGPDHMSTLNTINNLGNLYRNQGKLKEAEKLYQRAQAGYENALGPDHTSTLNTLNNLGNLYNNQKKPKRAEEMYQRALKGYEKALGPDHTATLNTVNNLGNLYSHQGKLRDAEEMYQRALEGCEKALGQEHISTLTTVYCLGLLYSNQGKLEDAEKMYQRALAGYEMALGRDHNMTRQLTERLNAFKIANGQ